jgi:DNA polymerase
MFTGPTGPIIDELLQGAGLSRDEVYMTNLVKCHLPKNRRPKQDEIEACSPYLAREIAAVDPAVLVPLGFYATRHILDSAHAPRPSARADFRNLYGRLILNGSRKVYPLPHPSALLHDRSFKPFMVKAYAKLRVLSRPCHWFPLCPIRRFVEQGRLDRSWIEAYCHGDWESCVRYRMEERGQPHPDEMLPDGTFLSNEI